MKWIAVILSLCVSFNALSGEELSGEEPALSGEGSALSGAQKRAILENDKAQILLGYGTENNFNFEVGTFNQGFNAFGGIGFNNKTSALGNMYNSKEHPSDKNPDSLSYTESPKDNHLNVYAGTQYVYENFAFGLGLDSQFYYTYKNYQYENGQFFKDDKSGVDFGAIAAIKYRYKEKFLTGISYRTNNNETIFQLGYIFN